jgi:hypothetical protein
MRIKSDVMDQTQLVGRGLGIEIPTADLARLEQTPARIPHHTLDLAQTILAQARASYLSADRDFFLGRRGRQGRPRQRQY